MPRKPLAPRDQRLDPPTRPYHRRSIQRPRHGSQGQHDELTDLTMLRIVLRRTVFGQGIPIMIRGIVTDPVVMMPARSVRHALREPVTRARLRLRQARPIARLPTRQPCRDVHAVQSRQHRARHNRQRDNHTAPAGQLRANSSKLVTPAAHLHQRPRAPPRNSKYPTGRRPGQDLFAT
jgi:hypothetical protein